MTSNDKIKALTAALNAMGFSQVDKLTVYQIGELEQIMKDEYGIEIHIKDNNELERLQTATKEYILTSCPALEVCGPFPDGKAKRRERRKLERLKKEEIMKVIELIELLESCELESEVYVHVQDNIFKNVTDAFDAKDENGNTVVVIN